MIRTFGDGVFTAVAVTETGRGWLAYREGDPRVPGAVVVQGWAPGLVGVHEILRVPLFGGSPCFPVLAVHEGLLWLAYHDGVTGHLRCVSTGRHELLDPCQNNHPIALGHGWVAWQGAGAARWPISRMHLTTGEVQPAGEGRGTGLAAITPEGRVVLVDENRQTEPGVTHPQRAGALVVAEGAEGGAYWRVGAERGVLWPGTDCFVPACAAAGDQFAIATFGAPHGVRLFVGTLAELRAAPTPTPVPNPTPDPRPEDPVSVTPALLRVLRETALKIDERHVGERSANLQTYNRRVAWALHQIDSRWGLKSAHGPDIGESKSHVAYRLTPGPTGRTPMHAFDYVRDETGVGSHEWHQPDNRNYIRPEPIIHANIEGQWWIAPSPVTGGDQDDPGDSQPRPLPPPPSDPRLEPVVRALTAEIARLGDLRDLVAAVPPVVCPEPEPHVCPTPRWPDDHECPTAGTTLTEPDAQAARRGWERIWRGPLPGDLLTFLLFRLLVEAAPLEDLDAEVGRRRG